MPPPPDEEPLVEECCEDDELWDDDELGALLYDELLEVDDELVLFIDEELCVQELDNDMIPSHKR